jgi:hypothetical protein
MTIQLLFHRFKINTVFHSPSFWMFQFWINNKKILCISISYIYAETFMLSMKTSIRSWYYNTEFAFKQNNWVRKLGFFLYKISYIHLMPLYGSCFDCEFVVPIHVDILFFTGMCANKERVVCNFWMINWIIWDIIDGL